jgi:hypothetical protein
LYTIIFTSNYSNPTEYRKYYFGRIFCTFTIYKKAVQRKLKVREASIQRWKNPKTI